MIEFFSTNSSELLPTFHINWPLPWPDDPKEMIEFFPTNSRALLPTFHINWPLPWPLARWGLIFPRWGLTLPRIPPPTPVLYSTTTHPFLRLSGMYIHKTPPTPPQKHPFSSAWGTSLRKVFYEAFIFSVFSRNQEKTKPLTWRSVSS